jgi:hypothetical protein
VWSQLDGPLGYSTCSIWVGEYVLQRCFREDDGRVLRKVVPTTYALSSIRRMPASDDAGTAAWPELALS